MSFLNGVLAHGSRGECKACVVQTPTTAELIMHQTAISLQTLQLLPFGPQNTTKKQMFSNPSKSLQTCINACINDLDLFYG